MSTFQHLLSTILLYVLSVQSIHDCAQEVGILCALPGGEEIHPNALCFAKDSALCGDDGLDLRHREAYTKQPDGSIRYGMFNKPDQVLIEAQRRGLQYKCFSVDKKIGLMEMVKTKCTDIDITFTITNSDWTNTIKPKMAKLAKKMEKEQKVKGQKEYSKSKKDADKNRKQMMKEHSVNNIKGYKWNGYKSKQGCFGDCVMHSINNVLNGRYLTNMAFGSLFVDDKKTQKIDESLSKSYEKNKPDREAVMVFVHGTSNPYIPSYYEAFGLVPIKKALSRFNAKQDIKVLFDWKPNNIKDLIEKIYKYRTDDKSRRLLGLRFIYWSRDETRHVVAIRYADRVNEQYGDKHWVYMNSWHLHKPLLLTDKELADYLISAEAGDENHRKELFPVYIEDNKQLMLPPPEEFDDVHVVYYWKCIAIQKRVKGMSPQQIHFECIKDAEKKAKGNYVDARTGYENKYKYNMDYNHGHFFESQSFKKSSIQNMAFYTNGGAEYSLDAMVLDGILMVVITMILWIICFCFGGLGGYVIARYENRKYSK